MLIFGVPMPCNSVCDIGVCAEEQWPVSSIFRRLWLALALDADCPSKLRLNNTLGVLRYRNTGYNRVCKHLHMSM